MRGYEVVAGALGFIVLLGGAVAYIVQAQTSIRKRRHAASPLLSVDQQSVGRLGNAFEIEYVLKNKGSDALRDVRAGVVDDGNVLVATGRVVLAAGEDLQVHVVVNDVSMMTPWVVATDADGRAWELTFDVFTGSRSARVLR